MNELREPYLLTPGPLTTSLATKSAMLRDWGSWVRDFNELTAGVRRRLLVVAHACLLYTSLQSLNIGLERGQGLAMLVQGVILPAQ